jgi:MFS family permease
MNAPLKGINAKIEAEELRKTSVAWTIAAAIATVSIVGVGLSLTIALIAVRLEMAGYSARMIGLNPAVGGIATLIGAPFVPLFARLLGTRRLIFVTLSISILCLLGFALTHDYWSWLALRLIYGATLTALFVVSEFWINAAAPPQHRGLVMGFYATSLAAGFAIGPLILEITGVDGMTPFLVAGGLCALGALPIAAARNQVPEVTHAPAMPVLAFLLATPIATLASLVFGAVETGAMGLLPVYALRSGMDARTATGLVSLFALGNVVFQIPIGFISDRFDRRRFLFVIGTIGLAGALLLPFAAATSFATFGFFLFVWGGIVGGLYAVGLAHLGACYRGPELASANAAFIMFYSMGMLAGPPILGFGLDIKPAGFFYGIALFFLLYLGIAMVTGRGQLKSQK